MSTVTKNYLNNQRKTKMNTDETIALARLEKTIEVLRGKDEVLKSLLLDLMDRDDALEAAEVK